MALFFVPLASVVLSSVRTEEEGVASGANGSFRELGAVLGIATLGAVFSARGGYANPADFVSGITGATWVGSAVLAVGFLATLFMGTRPHSLAGTPSLDVARQGDKANSFELSEISA